MRRIAALSLLLGACAHVAPVAATPFDRAVDQARVALEAHGLHVTEKATNSADLGYLLGVPGRALRLVDPSILVDPDASVARHPPGAPVSKKKSTLEPASVTLHFFPKTRLKGGGDLGRLIGMGNIIAALPEAFIFAEGALRSTDTDTPDGHVLRLARSTLCGSPPEVENEPELIRDDAVQTLRHDGVLVLQLRPGAEIPERRAGDPANAELILIRNETFLHVVVLP